MDSFTVTRIEIDGAGPLSSALTAHLSEFCDHMEDLGQYGVLFVHILGHVNSARTSAWPGETDLQLVSRWERLLRRIERSDAISIVLVERTCSALALELLAVADFRMATADFSMRPATPGEKIWPSMALHRLSKQIGEIRTRDLYLQTFAVTAKQGAEMAIVDEIVHDLPAALERIQEFLRSAPVDDFPVRRRLMQDSMSSSFEDALGAHLAACDRTLRRSSKTTLGTRK